MAGRLVADYGVGSEDDEPVPDQHARKVDSGASSSSNSGTDNRKKPSDTDKSKSSSRSSNMKEVESSRRRSRSRSRSRERRDRHHHHRSSKSKKDRHKRRSRSRSHSRDRRRRTRSRSQSRSRDRRRRNVRDDRRKRKSRSRSRSTRSRSRSSERRDKKSAAKSESNVPAKPNNAPGTEREALLPTPPMPVNQQVEAATQAAVLAAQRLLQSQLDQAKQQASTLPTFYNPAAVNTSRITEQMQKRKLLWANKEKKDTPATSKIWEATAFNQDQDGKMTAKFKRLMGIKNEAEAAGESSSATGDSAVPDVLKKQQELFATLDQQYEVARAATHTQRGLGLGFSSSGFHFPR